MTVILQKNDLQAGARVILDINGVAYESHIQEVQSNNYLLMDAPADPQLSARMRFNQPVYLMQDRQENGIICVLLRFIQHGVQDEPMDVFRIVRSTIKVMSYNGLQLPVCEWCDLTVFAMFNRARKAFAGRVQMVNLSETGLELIIPTDLPFDTFAECEFCIGTRLFQVPSRATHGKSSDNGAYHTMNFDFVHITKSERVYLRRYLFMEQARLLRGGAVS
jgi:hypothetical protein